MTGGIHHVTLITRKVQRNVDFYAGFLGLRLVKRTAGYEDARQLHLFYGDAVGSPGTLVTFLVWEDGSPGRVGIGQIGEIALAIPRASIGFWLTRAIRAGIATQGPADEFGEPVLRLKDPDGIIVKLVGSDAMASPMPWPAAGIPAGDEIGRIRAVTLFAEDVELTRGFLLRNFGYRSAGQAGTVSRLISASGDALDLRDAAGFWTSAPGTGTVDHVALRAADRQAVEQVHERLASSNASATNVHDRSYFYSLYVREPGGVLIELATDGPGMTIDEPVEILGSKLFFPPGIAESEADLTAVLPQFGLPGEPRTVYRELPFVHRLIVPETSDGSWLVLLHGSGGNETSLLPLAARAAPNATLLALRGRSFEEGVPRWFRRNAGSFDQADIRAEAEAFRAFVDGAVAAYGLDLDRSTFVGHSNGANFLAAVMTLHPGVARRAALLRPLQVLDTIGDVDLREADILVALGAEDSFRADGERLASILGKAGANVETVTTAAGHDLADADVDALRLWRSALGF